MTDTPKNGIPVIETAEKKLSAVDSASVPSDQKNEKSSSSET